MTDTHDDRQATCPEWAWYVSPEERRPVDYSNTPPGGARTWRVEGMAVGDEAWIMTFGIFRDDKGNLWAEGRVSSGHYEDTNGTVHVVRTEDGIRVLAWPHGTTIKEQRPNRYSDQRDIWVVEFPDQPTEASCLICRRERSLADMDYAPAETELGVEDAWVCRDDPQCVPWITNTSLGRSWVAGRS